jgi:hypothetical protein
MTPLEPQATCAQAHAAALAAAAAAPTGKVLHLVATITDPAAAHSAAYAAVLDGTTRSHAVTTVANTVFPSALYLDPGRDWAPDLTAADAAALDQAAADLYESYNLMLPGLVRADAGSARGTYFGCLVSWPGKEPGGRNQLAERISQLRKQRHTVKTFNATDLIVEGAGERPAPDPEPVPGLQVCRSSENRTMSFPCLVHIDVSVLDGRLSMLAVYRHWHLVRKAYGNLVGLCDLQRFLAQQSGYEIGELVVHAGVASTEQSHFGGARGIAALAARLAQHAAEEAA